MLCEFSIQKKWGEEMNNEEKTTRKCKDLVVDLEHILQAMKSKINVKEIELVMRTNLKNFLKIQRE